MFVRRLILHKNKLLRLNNITTFEITTDQIYQLLIGTNGSGKTTVLREFSVMPPDKDDYEEDGYKIIEFEDSGAEYKLTTTFSHGPRHSFERDGKILNDNGTGAIQKELIMRYLGVNQELMDILFDEEVFTHMSPLRRRDWLMKLSGNDFTYAMGIFKALQSKVRDIQGALKLFDKRLAEQVANLPTDEELQNMRSYSDRLKDDLTYLMEVRDNNLPDRQVVNALISSLMTEIENIANKILRARLTPVHGFSINSSEELAQVIKEQEKILAESQAKLDVYLEELASVQDIVAAMESSHASSVEELLDKQKEIELQQSTLTIQKPMQTNPSSQYSALISIYESLSDALTSLPHPYGNYTKDREEMRNNIFRDLTKRREASLDLCSRLSHRLEHIQKSSSTSCPKCGYVWTMGVKENEEEILQGKLNKERENLREAEEEIEGYKVHMEEQRRFNHFIRQINVLTSGNQSLISLWRDLGSGIEHELSNDNMILIVNQWKDELLQQAEHQRLSEEIQRLKEVYEHAVSTSSGDVSGLTGRLNSLTQNAETLTAEVTQLNTTLGALGVYQSQVTYMENLRDQMEVLVVKSHEETLRLVSVIRREHINKIINEKQVALARNESELNNAIMAKNIIEDIKHNKARALVDMEAYNAVIKELSPVDGLIAEQVKGFVNNFVDQLNGVIGEIWTYDFVIQSSDEGEELSYYFPFTINGNENIVKDVKRGSKAQVEVVNWAFKLVTMLYMGKQRLPLFADEPLPSLDEQHQINLVAFLKNYMEGLRAPQLFLISHYLNARGAFPSAQVCVMSSANLVNKPGEYNRHVVMR